ncbi:MAG: hypothetical protein PHP17_05385 [Candidatus Omnitrophica bacterium]|nr:hypothetical protein [Candidatus Omnitrophota bacterium]
MKYLKYSVKSAQSFLEYSLLIAVGISALIIMQYYFGRSVQGLLKQNVDNLGGEKLGGQQQYSPGKWYTGTSTTRIGTSGFEYEGRKGFNVATGTMQRSQVSRITGTTAASDLPAENLTYNSLIDGDDVNMVNSVYGSDLDPGIATVNSQINNNATWHNNTPPVEGQENDPGTGIDGNAERVVNEHVNSESVNIDE